MFAAYMHSVRESINKRMALVLIGVAILFALLLFFRIIVKPMANGTSMIFIGQHMLGPASLGVPAVEAQEIQFTGTLWLFLSIFAAVPLLVSSLEKGWVELTLTKGIARWKALLGAYFAGLTLYAATLAVAMFPLALWLWAKTGISCKPLLIAIAIEVLAFGSLLSLAAFASLTRTGAALPIMLSIFVFILAPFLASRERGLFELITSNWGRAIITWMYRILPKTSELVSMCIGYIQQESFGSWFPLWSTGTFIVAMMGLTIWTLHRKNL
jgi:hypothetical protein